MTGTATAQRRQRPKSNFMRRVVQVSALPLFVVGLMALSDCAHQADNSSERIRCDQTRAHHDGDTFTCVSHGESFIVRVASVDAPETGQGYWRVARSRLRELAGDGSVVDCYKVDRHSRRVCRVTASDGEDVATALLREGLAWYPTAFAHEDAPSKRRTYVQAESEAQLAHRGLWSEPGPMPPWQCRREKEQGRRCR